MINFDRSSITDGKYTPAGVTHFSLKSSHLGARGEITTYMPDVARGVKDLPFIILLHGVYGSHFSWLYQGGAGVVLEQLIDQGTTGPALLVMPSDGLNGDGTGYLPHKDANYEKWITEDVLEAIRYQFAEISSTSPAFITGLSMGGYGALRLGMKYHHIFNGVSGHSSITDLDDLKTFIEDDIDVKLDTDTILRSSLLSIALQHKAELPPIRFDCGIADPLILSNRKLHDALIGHGIKHTYEEFEGAHSYAYWNKHIADTFTYFDQIKNNRPVVT